MKLREAQDLAEVSAVWPFETGFTTTPGGEERPFVLHAEIWPSLMKWDQTGIKDEWQVRNTLGRFARLDEHGSLAALFAPPEALDASEIEVCCSEEGWILGA
jgi:hypothetical protein